MVSESAEQHHSTQGVYLGPSHGMCWLLEEVGWAAAAEHLQEVGFHTVLHGGTKEEPEGPQLSREDSLSPGQLLSPIRKWPSYAERDLLL